MKPKHCSCIPAYEICYVITPDCEKHEIGKYYGWSKDDEDYIEITKDEYDSIAENVRNET